MKLWVKISLFLAGLLLAAFPFGASVLTMHGGTSDKWGAGGFLALMVFAVAGVGIAGLTDMDKRK